MSAWTTEGVRATRASPTTDEEHDARRCAVCGGRSPPFGYGPPVVPRGGPALWACGAHRTALETELRRANAGAFAEPVPEGQASLF